MFASVCIIFMLIGHQRIWDLLIKSAGQNKLAHAYLFCGPAELGKKTLTLELAKRLLCSDKKNNSACGVCKNCADIEKNRHPDVFLLAPRQEEKKGVVKTFEIGIDETRALCRHLSLSPYSSSFKIAIIDEAEKMTNEAVNSFLKTLEEPGANSHIFILTSEPRFILSTIVSRCQTINFFPVALERISKGLAALGFNGSAANKAAKLSAGRPGRAIKICRDDSLLKKQEENFNLLSRLLRADLSWRMELAGEMAKNIPLTKEILSQWLLRLRDGFLENCGCAHLAFESKKIVSGELSNFEISRAARQMQKTRAILANSSFDSKLALEVMMMKI